MSLTSPLFTAPGPGKALLDRCAVANDGHFFLGMPARNGLADAVGRIRTALNQLGYRSNDPPGVYGPSTADAVFRFKAPPRNILGPGQRVPDKIVGIQTLARLDAELQATPAPPQAAGSTAWNFGFFGNKGFKERGLYTLWIGSAQLSDRREFTIFERSAEGSLWAGFKGECHGSFTTPRKARASEFGQASATLSLWKGPLQAIAEGDLQLHTLGVALSMKVRLPISLRDETMGSSLTSGNFLMRGDLSA